MITSGSGRAPCSEIGGAASERHPASGGGRKTTRCGPVSRLPGMTSWPVLASGGAMRAHPGCGMPGGGRG